MPLTRPVASNKDFESLSYFAQSFYFRCRDEADDLGYLPAEPEWLKGRLFPFRNEVRLDHISSLIDQLCKSGMARSITNRRGRPVLLLPDCIQEGKRKLKSDHVDPKENDQLFLPTAIAGVQTVQKKEGRKEGVRVHVHVDEFNAMDAVEDLPIHFPKTKEDAIARGATGGYPEVFIVDTWNKAMSRGGRDAKMAIIRRFNSYLATEYSFHQQRLAEQTNGTHQKFGNKSNGRNHGTLNSGKASQYSGMGKVVRTENISGSAA